MGGSGGSISPSSPQKINMTSDNIINQFKEQLCKARADKARQHTKVKAEVE